MASSPLSDRARKVLVALVREYVETGQPGASLSLARHGGFAVSSATLRSVLAQLEELGYVRQPHTSAGRVPTDLGYRCYVDMLLESRRPVRATPTLEAQLRGNARRPALMDEMLSNVTHVLSSASHHLGFAVALASEEAAFHRIDFLPLVGSRVLVVVVARGGQVSEKVIDVREPIAPDDLQQAANYLNTEFAGLPLSRVRAIVLERLHEERALYDQLLARALRLAESTFEDLAPRPTVHVEGAASLLDASMVGGVPLEPLRALLRILEEKHRLVRLLTEYIEGPGLTVVIGTEHTAPDLREFSLIFSTYQDGERIGSVGVIGPTRMRYSRAIAVVDSAAQTLSRLLREAGWDVKASSN